MSYSIPGAASGHVTEGSPKPAAGGLISPWPQSDLTSEADETEAECVAEDTEAGCIAEETEADPTLAAEETGVDVENAACLNLGLGLRLRELRAGTVIPQRADYDLASSPSPCCFGPDTASSCSRH